MRTYKHIGKMKNTGAKVLVVFRTLPGDSGSALVLPTATLPDAYHDSIMQLVESEQAQETNELGEIMFTRMFPDGRPMLTAMQQDGRLQKSATDMVLMTPTPNQSVPLDQLNVLIAEQRNCAVDDLASFVTGASQTDKADSAVEKAKIVKETSESVAPLQANTNTVLSDKDIARNYRSQADAMYKEAARLRREADELDPPVKKTSKAKEAESA